MAIEDWIDTLTKVWEISDGQGGTVYSYRVYDKAEFPESIGERIPCAITYPAGARFEISANSGKSYWEGVTEFHLSEDVDKSKFPEILLFYARIRTAMAANMKLGGIVDHFQPRPGAGSNIQGPVVLKYGSESPNLGIVVYWEVKQDETDAVSV